MQTIIEKLSDLTSILHDFIYKYWRVRDNVSNYDSLYDVKPDKDKIIWGIVHLSPQLSLAYYEFPSPCYEILVTKKDQQFLTWATVGERSEYDTKFIYDIETHTCKSISILSEKEVVLSDDNEIKSRLKKIISTLELYMKTKNKIADILQESN
jgi:hypothetical protein